MGQRRRADAAPVGPFHGAEQGELGREALPQTKARNSRQLYRCVGGAWRSKQDQRTRIEVAIDFLVNPRSVTKADLRRRAWRDGGTRGPTKSPAVADCLSQQYLWRQRGGDARCKLQVCLSVFRLKAAPDTQPVGQLDGDARGCVVGPQRGALPIECACPVRIFERGVEPEWRVEKTPAQMRSVSRIAV